MRINHLGHSTPPSHIADRPVTYVSLNEGSYISILTTPLALSSSPPASTPTLTANNSPLHTTAARLYCAHRGARLPHRCFSAL